MRISDWSSDVCSADLLYVTGVDESFSRLSSMLLSPNTATTHQKALCRFESIQPFAAQDKDFVVATDAVHAALEVVLHASVHDSDILQAFVSYVDTLGGTAHLDRALCVAGLSFVPVTLSPLQTQALATRSNVV